MIYCLFIPTVVFAQSIQETIESINRKFILDSNLDRICNAAHISIQGNELVISQECLGSTKTWRVIPSNLSPTPNKYFHQEGFSEEESREHYELINEIAIWFSCLDDIPCVTFENPDWDIQETLTIFEIPIWNEATLVPRVKKAMQHLIAKLGGREDPF